MSKNIDVIAAIICNDIDKVREFLNTAVDVNDVRDIKGNTALDHAIYYDRIEIFKLLLEYKDIDVNVKNKWGNTALTTTAFEGKFEMFKLLLEHEDIDVNARNFVGNSILMNMRGSIEMFKLLLERKDINIDMYDKNGNTALDLAVKCNYVEMIDLLKQAGQNE